MDKDLRDDPRVISMAHRLGSQYILGARTSSVGATDLSSHQFHRFWCNAVTGALHALWCYADEHLPDDSNRLEIPLESVDAIVGLEGFAEAVSADWLIELDDGRIELPGYSEKTGLITKRKRAVQAKDRVRAFRAKRAAMREIMPLGNGVHSRSVTQHVTQHVTQRVTALPAAQDLDQDLDLNKTKTKLPRAKARSLLPVGLKPSEADRSYAVSRCGDMDVDRTFEDFVNHHTGKGTLFADPSAGWRTWVGNCQKGFSYVRRSRRTIQGDGPQITAGESRRIAAGESLESILASRGSNGSTPAQPRMVGLPSRVDGPDIPGEPQPALAGRA